jgi:type VI secretion system protein ImpA
VGHLDLEGLLRPAADAAPCGDNLEYDPEFGELDRAARTTPEQVIGNTVIAAEPPDWRVVSRRATALFGRTKDLRVAMQLVKALLVTEGIPGFRDGLELLARLLTEYWDGVHPQLDPEDDNDPTPRVNVLSELCGRETLLRDLRSAPLARSQALGTVTYRDVALAIGEVKPVHGATPKSMAEIEAVFLDCDADELLAMAAAALTCVHRLAEIEAILGAKVSAARAVDLSPALVLMRGIVKFLQERVSERGLIIEPEAASGGPSAPARIDQPGAGAAPTAVPAMTGEITSRDEVVRVLERICAYYDKFEPSSPVPLLLTRAKRLVAKNFIDVLRDIAPDAVAQAEAVRGRDAS